MPLRAFRKQPRIFHSGRFFTCTDIIQFMANKAGGAHLDYNRSKDEAAEAAFRWCTFGAEPGDAAFRPPGALHFAVEPGYRDTLTAFHVEIIAAAASFVQMRVNGKTLMPLEFHKSVSSRVRGFLGLKKRLMVQLYERQPPQSSDDDDVAEDAPGEERA
jgi:hypothetical protein